MPGRVSDWVDDATGGASLPSLDGLQDAFMSAIQGGIDIIFKTLDFFGFTEEETAVEPDDFGFNEENTRDLAGSPGAEQIERETNAQTFTPSEYEPAGATGEGMENTWGNLLNYYESFEIIGQSLIGVYLALLIIAAGVGLYGKSKLTVKFGRAVAALVLIALGPSLIAQLIDLSNMIALSFIESAFADSPMGQVADMIGGIGGIAVGIVLALPIASFLILSMLTILLLYVFTEIIIMMLFVIFPLLMVGWTFGRNSLVFSPFNKAARVFVPTLFLPAGLSFVLWATLTIPFDMVGDGSDGIIESSLWFILTPLVFIGMLIGGSYLVLKATWAGKALMGSVGAVVGTVAGIGLAATAGGKAAAGRTAISALGGGSSGALRQANQEQMASSYRSSISGDGSFSSSAGSDSDGRDIGEKPADEPNMGATNPPEEPSDGGLFNQVKDRAKDSLSSTSSDSEADAGQEQMEFDMNEEVVESVDWNKWGDSAYNESTKGEVAGKFFSRVKRENAPGNRPSAVEAIENSDEYSDLTPELQDTFEQAENGDPDAVHRLNDRQDGNKDKYYVGDLGDTRSDYLSEQEIKDFGPDSDYGASSSAESSSTASASSEAGSSATASGGASSGSSSSPGGSGGAGPSQSSQGGGRQTVDMTQIANNDVDNGDLVDVDQEIEQVEKAGENNVAAGYDGVAEVRGSEQQVAINDYNGRDPEIVDQNGNEIDDLDGRTITRIENAEVGEYDPQKGGPSELHNFDSAAKGAYDSAQGNSSEAFKEIRLGKKSTVVVEDESN